MRTITIVQGLTILMASVYTLDDPRSFYLVASFGVIFTYILAHQQRNYLKDFECHLEVVGKLEKKVWCEGEDGPWAAYEKRHNELRKEGRWLSKISSWLNRPSQNDGFRVFVEYGPSVLFAVAFILLLILNILLVILKYADDLGIPYFD